MMAASRQLSAAVGAALGRNWPVPVVFCDLADDSASGVVWIVSMAEDATRREDIEVTTRRWMERIGHLARPGERRILLTTLFRCVSPAQGAQPTIERIRRLNVMAMHLSRSTGIEIVDIDRLFALHGARALGSDYRCLGPHAAELAGHAIAACIFEGGLDEFLSAHIQEEAARRHGGAEDLSTILQRRISG